jgi:hypothetical protein
MAIPDRMSFATAFEIRTEAFFANVVLETCYDNDGHYGFINNPFTNSGVNSSNSKKQMIVVDGSKDEASTNDDENLVACRLVSSQEGRSSKNMSFLVSKSQTIKEHWHVVLVCAIASNARMASVNVDSSGRMGPLIDANTEFHNSAGRSELLHYERLFRPGSINFMSLLGPEIQRSPVTHPQRCLDPSRLWLMQCNGGPSSWQARDGLSF